MAEYRDKPIMDLANRIDQEFGREASEHVLGLYQEANDWHRTARDLSSACARKQDELTAASSKLQACEKQRDEWKAYADAGLQNSVSLQAEVASYASRLSSALEERDVLKAGQAAAQATHGRMLAQAADADEKINGLESRLDLYRKACAEAQECTRIMEGITPASCMEQLNIAPELVALMKGSDVEKQESKS